MFFGIVVKSKSVFLRFYIMAKIVTYSQLDNSVGYVGRTGFADLILVSYAGIAEEISLNISFVLISKNRSSARSSSDGRR